MQCPDCGYEADAAAIFCPQCRFQFRDITGEPVQTTDTIIDHPERGVIADESILEETQTEERDKAFTDKELRQLEVQLLQPAVLVVLIIALVSYTVLSAVPFISLTIAGLIIGVTGIICLACGLFFGMIFYFLMWRSLVKFRSR
jgi:uncharacterized membrane protein